ncbi:hypothetical protein LAUMK41_03759 [Mycobacterium attenuatum]|nr:hypothetical protein LAUMK41_03759 [Mycobacterium attenuatum]
MAETVDSYSETVVPVEAAAMADSYAETVGPVDLVGPPGTAGRAPYSEAAAVTAVPAEAVATVEAVARLGCSALVATVETAGPAGTAGRAP